MKVTLEIGAKGEICENVFINNFDILFIIDFLHYFNLEIMH